MQLVTTQVDWTPPNGVDTRMHLRSLSPIIEVHDKRNLDVARLGVVQEEVADVLLRPQRRLLQVANLGTSSSRRTIVAFKEVGSETQIGTPRGRIRCYLHKGSKNWPTQISISHTLNLGTV